VIRLIEKKGLGSRKNYCFHIVRASISATKGHGGRKNPYLYCLADDDPYLWL